MKARIVLTMVAVLVLAGALIVAGSTGAFVAQAQEPEPTPVPTEAPPPPPEEPQLWSDSSKSGPSGESTLQSLNEADLDLPVPAGVPAGWQRQWKVIPGTAFHPRFSTTTYSAAGGGQCIYATAGGSEIFVMDLWLPDGAIIDFFRLYYYDTNAANSTLFLTAYDFTGGYDDIAWVYSSGTGGYGDDYVQTPTFAEYTVDNFDTPLLFNWRPNFTGSNEQLCGVRLGYWTPPGFGAFMPLIQR